MGTGPWEVDSLDPTTGAKLSANPYWWGGAVPIQNISFQIFANATSEALAFRAGDVDLDPIVVGPKSFAASSGATIEAAPSCLNGMLDMNVHAPGWDDAHVRRTVAYALDRAEIIDAFGGYAVPDYTLIPVSALGTIASQEQVNALFKSLPLYPYNLAKAKDRDGRVQLSARVQYAPPRVQLWEHRRRQLLTNYSPPASPPPTRPPALRSIRSSRSGFSPMCLTSRSTSRTCVSRCRRALRYRTSTNPASCSTITPYR